MSNRQKAKISKKRPAHCFLGRDYKKECKRIDCKLKGLCRKIERELF